MNPSAILESETSRRSQKSLKMPGIDDYEKSETIYRKIKVEIWRRFCQPCTFETFLSFQM